MTRARHILRPGPVFLFLAFVVGFAGLAMAQLSPGDRGFYERWKSTAERAERIIDAGRVSSVDLERLRADIAGYREQFASVRDQNSARIKTLQSQLDALGPAPATGDEPEDIANLRRELNAQLDKLRVPRVVSEEAYNRANGLIGEIDRIIRERQTRRLLSRGPSPLNPAYWPDAAQDLRAVGASLVAEIANAWASGKPAGQIRENGPAIAVLIVIGLVLLARSGRWSDRLGDYLRRLGGTGTGIWTFLMSLAKVVLQFIGIIALVGAMSLTGLPGPRGTLVLEEIPAWGLILLVFRWLGAQVIARRENDEFLPLAVDRRGELRLLVNLLALMLVLRGVIVLFGQIENMAEATRAVLAFPPILITALALLRLQRVGLREREAAEAAGEEPGRGIGTNKIVRAIRRAAVLLGVVSPVLAGFGYVYAAESIIYPAVMTLVIVSVVLTLQGFVSDVYAWVSGKGDEARDSLFSVLAGFVLALLAIPFLALVWGARMADLTELWARFLEGFDIGGTRISPSNFMAFALIFVVGYMVTRLLQSGLRTSLLPKTGIDPGGQNAIVSGTGYVGIFLSALVAISGAGLDLSSLAIVAGALSVGIGFGLQTIVSNFVSGIILLIERPIAKGDWIEVGGQMGYVRDISVRSTRIETFDRTDVIVPNSDLISGTVTNYTRGNTIGRVIVPVGVAYGTDTRRVEKLLSDIANAHPMVLANPPPSVVFQGFGADSLDFEIRAILRDVNWVLSVKSDLNHEIARVFTQEGIEIPFAQRDIWLRNPEVLPGGDRSGT